MNRKERKLKKRKIILRYSAVIILTTVVFGGVMVLISIFGWVPERKIPEFRIWGKTDAPIKVEVYTDLQCPACSNAHEKLNELKQKYPDIISVKFKYLPLPFHRWGVHTAAASECGGRQGKFEIFANELFHNQSKWAEIKDDIMPYLLELAENLSLDTKKFHKCITLPETVDTILLDFREAQKRGVDATPTFFVNGRKRTGFEDFEKEFNKRVKKYELK